MSHSLMIVGVDLRLLAIAVFVSTDRNIRLGLARRTNTAPIRLVRTFDRVERRPRRPPTCLV